MTGGSLESDIVGCVYILRTGGFVSRGECVSCARDGAFDVAGFEVGRAEVMYAGCKVGSSGDCRSNEDMLVMLLPAIESAIEDP